MIKLLRIDSKKCNELFYKIVDKAVELETPNLNDWDVSCKGNAEERKQYYLSNKFECIENYYHYECLDAWNSVEEMEQDIGGSNSLYLDVIETVTGKLPYGRLEYDYLRTN